MSVYIVVAREDNEIKVCEAYAGATSALGRAFQVASDLAGPNKPDLWDHSPNEEKYLDRSVRWVFMDTNRRSVIVFYRPTIETSIPSAKDSISTVVVAVQLPAVMGTLSGRPFYDFSDRSLPAGWKLDGKPALMSDLIDNPLDVQDPDSLSEAQKWALVIARISKSLGWRGTPKGTPILWFHRDSLRQLKDKSGIGKLLRDGEIELLHHLREDLVKVV